MNNNTKKIISYLIAATMFANSHALKASASTVNEEEETNKEVITRYEVQPNDTLGKIAQRFYGDEKYYIDIANYNNIHNPSYIYVGEMLLLPETFVRLEEKEEKEETLNDEDKEYIIKKGETLGYICDVYYDDKTYETILRLATYNNISNPNYVYENQKILLPNYDKLQKVQYNWVPYQTTPVYPSNYCYNHHIHNHVLNHHHMHHFHDINCGFIPNENYFANKPCNKRK